MKKAPQIKYFINETISRPVSKKEFFRIQKEEIIGDSVPRNSLIKAKTFTNAQMKTLIEKKIFVPIKYKFRVYFTKEDIKTAYKYLYTRPPNLFSLEK